MTDIDPGAEADTPDDPGAEPAPADQSDQGPDAIPANQGDADTEPGPAAQSDERTGLTRRDVIAGAAAGAAAAGAAGALPAAAEAQRRRRRRRRRRRGQGQGAPGTSAPGTPTPAPSMSADVVVAGGGLAGLTAARNVVGAGKSVIVLEARDRVGGRVWNRDLGGGKVTEGGAEFVGFTQGHIINLAKALGVGMYEAYDPEPSNNVYVYGGQKSTYDDHTATGIVPPDPMIIPDVVNIVNDLDTMATQVSVDSPWTAASAADWDQQSFETWLRANSSNNAHTHKIVSSYTRAAWGAEPRDLSLLYVVFYVASSGDEQHVGTVERNISGAPNSMLPDGGAQRYRLIGGTQQVPLRMAAQLGSRVMLNQPVRRIDATGSAVRVTTDSLTVGCRRVIVAMAPSLAGRIVYEPGLPELRDQLMQRTPVGALMKVDVVYDRPFWRDQGFNGTIITDRDPANIIFDSSPPDGRPGVLLGFVGGDAARTWGPRSMSDRRAAVIAAIVEALGPQGANPINYFETDWNAEQFSRGCPVGIMQAGTLTGYGPALRQPVGTIHWAGTETSTYWNGYMDGAVRSGERAAREVLAEL